MFRTLFVVLAVVAALLPGVAVVVCAALIALGLAPRTLVIIRCLAARGARVQPASLRALSLLRAPPSLLA